MKFSDLTFSVQKKHFCQKKSLKFSFVQRFKSVSSSWTAIMRFLSKVGTMRELASVALWEHFNLDPETAVWRYNDAEPMPLPPTSGGHVCPNRRYGTLVLYQTVHKNDLIELHGST